MNISDEAVEAAAEAMEDAALSLIGSDLGTTYRNDIARRTLEAAAPHMLSHEHQQTADAHRDAIVNRDTADRLERELETEKATVWDEAANVLYMGNAINQDHLKTMWERNPYRSQA